VIKVIVRGEGADELHLEPLGVFDDTFDVPARVDHEALARAHVADEVDEVLHLFGGTEDECFILIRRVQRNVAAGQQLPEPQPTLGGLLGNGVSMFEFSSAVQRVCVCVRLEGLLVPPRSE
jgi:hypothetical protein